MRIFVLKFGNTPLYYTRDGTVAKGIIYTRKSFTSGISEWVFAASVVLLVTLFTATSGSAYAARFAVAMGLENAPFFEKLFPESTMVNQTPEAPASAPAVMQSATATVFHAERAVISIPAVHVTVPVVETAGNLAALDADLVKGVVRWPFSIPFAAGGTTVILGHSSAPLGYDGSYGSVFANLDQLVNGAEVTVSDGSQTLRYRVIGRLVVERKDFDDATTLAGDGERLVLVTCWPTGTSWKRIAITALRVK